MDQPRRHVTCPITSRACLRPGPKDSLAPSADEVHGLSDVVAAWSRVSLVEVEFARNRLQLGRFDQTTVHHPDRMERSIQRFLPESQEAF